MIENITAILKHNNINNWDQLTQYIMQLPYGRNANRTDFSLVIKEKKGTCSSKHALLKMLAPQFTTQKVTLIIGIFKMNKHNMPKLNEIFSKNNLHYIPEAHCYLKVNEIVYDYTTTESLYPKIQNDIIQEIAIEPYQVADYKVHYHQEFIKKWIQEEHILYNFEQIWQIREECIKQLSKVI